MTRQEYLSELKYHLRALSVEEQEEALEYYRGYFDDADDDERVMAEFGEPKQLAQSIISKFATVPEVRQKQQNSSNDGTYGSFGSDEVRSLDISLGTAEVVMATGTSFSVDYRGLLPGDIRYGLSPFGTFSVENVRKIPPLNFWSHDGRREGEANHPRILIKIPQGAKLDSLRLHIGAGSFRTKDVSFVAARLNADVGAGAITLEGARASMSQFRCGMGSITFAGVLERLTKIDCGMGSVSLTLQGNPDDYSIDAKVGLGTVKFNDTKKEGMGTILCDRQKENHFSVNCGMGSIKIQMAQKED